MNNCPVCKKEMELKEIHGVSAFSCALCGGIWLGKGDMNVILHPDDWDVEYCTTEHGEDAPRSEKQCPECQEIYLRKGNFIEYSNIVLDYCPDCGGIWLDRGELDDITRELESLRHVPDSWQHKIMVFLSKLPV